MHKTHHWIEALITGTQRQKQVCHSMHVGMICGHYKGGSTEMQFHILVSKQTCGSYWLHVMIYTLGMLLSLVFQVLFADAYWHSYWFELCSLIVANCGGLRRMFTAWRENAFDFLSTNLSFFANLFDDETLGHWCTLMQSESLPRRRYSTVSTPPQHIIMVCTN